LIDPRAIISPQAELARDVEVGPYSIVGPDVSIDAGTRIGPHVVVNGPTRIGRDNRIYAFCAIGGDSQDKKYEGEEALLEIGDRNTIREFCTLNRGTRGGGGTTRIGDDNWIMAYVHIAHDCQVGNDVTFSNSAQLAGHVRIADHAVLGGFVGVHQFCRIGEHAMIAAGSVVLQDVPPYVTAAGFPAKPHGTNNEGLRRRGITAEDLSVIKRAYKTLYRSQLSLDEARSRIAEDALASPALLTLAALPNSKMTPSTWGLLSLSGICTAVPLLFFGAALRRLSLSTLGFLQYIGPTLQFLVAIWLFHEPLDHAKLLSFLLCWLGIAVYLADSLINRRRPQPVADEPE